MARPTAKISVVLDAPIGRVWEVLTALDRYADWNPFIVRIDGAARPKVGDALVLHVQWHDGGGVASGELVTHADPPGDTALLAWRYTGILPALNCVRAERQQRLTSLPNGTTRYESEEGFDGWLSMFVPLTRVQRGFEQQAEALAAAVRQP